MRRDQRRWNNRYSGREAGHPTRHGYRVVMLDYEAFQAHRLAVKWVSGLEPSEIDHRDRNGANNRWENLRPATPQQQNRNRRVTRNMSGFRGVHRHGKRWKANIGESGVVRYLGAFDTREEASAVYEAAARELPRTFYYNALARQTFDGNGGDVE